MGIELNIHVLAVLRAAVEKQDFGTYFGSTMAASYWVEETWLAGLLTSSDMSTAEATSKGMRLYEHLRLDKCPQGRAYLWSDTAKLVKDATDWLLTQED